MSIEEDIRQSILAEFGKKLKLEGKEVRIIVQDKPPRPEELSKEGTYLQLVGRLKDRFIYALKKGFQIIAFITTITAIDDAYNDIKLFVPKAYEFVKTNADQLERGIYSAFQSGNEKEDGYLVFKHQWTQGEQYFEQDYDRLRKGGFGTLNTPDAAYFPASGSSGSIVNGTTSNIDFNKT